MRAYNGGIGFRGVLSARIWIFLLIVLGGICCPGLGGFSVFAKTDMVQAVMEGFKKWYGTAASFHADFHQKTSNPQWGDEQDAQGEIWFKKPGLMHWKYSSPQQDVIVVNEEGLFWYMPEEKQLIKRGKDEAFRAVSPMSILGENMELEKDFEILGIEEIREKGNGVEKGNLLAHSIHVKPKDPQVGITQIRIEVAAGTFSLAAIEVEETAGGRNRIEFANIRVNPALPADLFLCTPPEGTKVITPEDFPAL